MNAPLSGNNATNNNGSSTYGMTPEQASKNFDALRREATKLERHLEDRVARYQQVSFCSFILVMFDLLCAFFLSGGMGYIVFILMRGEWLFYYFYCRLLCYYFLCCQYGDGTVYRRQFR